MTKFKPLKNLEECREIKVGEMVGIGQAITDTIPARCISNDNKNIELIGNMDNKVIILYTFAIDKIEGFYDDGSIRTKLDGQEFIEENDKEYNNYKKFWEGLQK